MFNSNDNNTYEIEANNLLIEKLCNIFILHRIKSKEHSDKYLIKNNSIKNVNYTMQNDTMEN